MEICQIIKAVFMKNIALTSRHKVDTMSLFIRPLLKIMPYVILGNYVFKSVVNSSAVVNVENYKIYIVISLIVLNLTTNGVYLAMNLLEDEIQRGNIENLLVGNIEVGKYFFVELVYRYVEQVIFSVIIFLVCVVMFKVEFTLEHEVVFLLVLLSSCLFSFGLGFILSGLTMKTKMTKLAYMVLSMVMFLSGELYPITSFPIFLKWLAYINPLTYILDLTRYSVLNIDTYLDVNVEILLCVLLGLCVLVWGSKKFNFIIEKLKHKGSLTSY